MITTLERPTYPPVGVGAFKVQRGALEGPLQYLIPVYIDVETYFDEKRGISLGSMTLRQYIQRSHLTSIAIAEGEGPVDVSLSPGGVLNPEIISYLKTVALDPKYVFVCHNASFDIRVLRFMLGIPQPQNVWCSMEGAMGAWPECVGGFSLRNLGEYLHLADNLRKIDVHEQFGKSLEELSDDELKEYNGRDVVSMREVYLAQAGCLPAGEQEIALMTHYVRQFKFQVDPKRLEALITKLDQNANDAQEDALEFISMEEMADIFNRNTDDGTLRSVRVARLSRLIETKWNMSLPTTSLKKLSPIIQAKYPEVTALLKQSGRVNKMLSHGRRSKVFKGVPDVDVELGYFRAHTGRFSSPSTGKGLNLHNCVSVSSCILTHEGFRHILSVKKGDKLWDGVQFSNFAEITFEGNRTTGMVGRAELTSEHPVWDGTKMIPAGELTRFQLVRAVVAGFSSTMQGLQKMQSDAAVLDAARKLSEWFNTSRNQLAVAGAPIADVPEFTISDFPTNNSDSCESATTICVTAATASDTTPTRRSKPEAMEPACVENGAGTSANSSNTASSFLAGMTRLSKWIEKTTIEGTSQEISDLFLAVTTSGIDALVSSQKLASLSLRTVNESVSNMQPGTDVSDLAVFDIRGVGTRARFLCDGVLSANCPKHDKSVAQPIREVFRMPPDKCLVRGDLANVEFRIEGWLTKAHNVLKMFDALLGGNIFNDPYCLTWTAMTRAAITKKDPVRQVAKAAVLGLGFCMSAEGFAKVLLGVLADPKSGVTEAALGATAVALGWAENKYSMKRIMDNTACNALVANVAFHVHRLFNEAYPEFSMTADWLFACVDKVAGLGGNRDDARRAIDQMYLSNRAPDRDRIGLEIDGFDRGDYSSIRVRCGPWTPTICWREPLVRMVFDPRTSKSRPQLTILKATGQEKAFTRQLAIENVTQSAARNSLCSGLLTLKKMGHQNILHIHDEVMLIVDRKREAVLKAKETLLSVFGPGSGHPLGWAIVIKPEEVTITESMWEDEMDVAVPALDAKTGKMSKGNDRWGKIERNEKDMFAMLP